MGDPHFRRNLIYVAAFHILLVAALLYFARREIRRPAGDIVWMDPGSFSQIAAADHPQEHATGITPEPTPAIDSPPTPEPTPPRRRTTPPTPEPTPPANAGADSSTDTGADPGGRHDPAPSDSRASAHSDSKANGHSDSKANGHSDSKAKSHSETYGYAQTNREAYT